MTDTGEGAEEPQFSSVFGTVLEPGSSFSPAFLLVVDGTFITLFVVLVTFAVLTRGNIHLIFLTLIELALWASVKWFVREWNLGQNDQSPSPGESKFKTD